MHAMRNLLLFIALILSFVLNSSGQSDSITGNLTPCTTGTYEYALQTDIFPTGYSWWASDTPFGFNNVDFVSIANPGNFIITLDITEQTNFFLNVVYYYYDFNAGFEMSRELSAFIQVTPPDTLDIQLAANSPDHVAVFFDQYPVNFSNLDLHYTWQAPDGWSAVGPDQNSVICYASTDAAGDVIATISNTCGVGASDTVQTGFPNCDFTILSQTIPYSFQYCNHPFTLELQTWIELAPGLPPYALPTLGDQTVLWNLPADFTALSPLDSTHISALATTDGTVSVSLSSNCGSDVLTAYHYSWSYNYSPNISAAGGYDSFRVVYAYPGEVVNFNCNDTLFVSTYADSVVWSVPNHMSILHGEHSPAMQLQVGNQSDSIQCTVYFPCDEVFTGFYHIEIQQDICSYRENQFFDFEVGDEFHFSYDSIAHYGGVWDTMKTYHVERVLNKTDLGGANHLMHYAIAKRNFAYVSGQWLELASDTVEYDFSDAQLTFTNDYSCNPTLAPLVCEPDTATLYSGGWVNYAPGGFVTSFGSWNQVYAPRWGQVSRHFEAHAPNSPSDIYVDRKMVFWQRAGLDSCGIIGIPATFFQAPIAEAPLMDFLLYPNPTDGKYYLKVRDGISVQDVMVYNAVGQLVADFIMPGNQLAFDLNHTGVYLMKIRTSQGNWVRKFSASF